jgi:hypothetical protein
VNYLIFLPALFYKDKIKQEHLESILLAESKKGWTDGPNWKFPAEIEKERKLQEKYGRKT